MGPIAFLGTGLMGKPMAVRLLGAGFAVTLWNRTPDKAESLVASGANRAQTPARAVAGAQVVIAMLTDANATRAVLLDPPAAGAMARGTVVVDMSTNSPSEAKQLAADLAMHGVEYVDAPVSGGTRGAAAGTLAIMAGGEEATIARLAPVFTAMGNVRRVGPVGAGQLCKLANQLIVAVTIGAVAEALTLAEKGGVDPAAVREALRGGFADSRILAEHGQRMISRNFAPGGTVDNQIKDLDAAQSFASEMGVTLPLLDTARQLFLRLRSDFGGNLDHSALFLEISKQ